VDSIGIEPSRLPTGPLPQISADIPANVLARRPDISALELRLREALTRVDIKRADYYPAFNLTGALGGSSAALLNLIGQPIATLSAQLTLPFLQWQQRNVDIKIARNDYEQRVLEFKQALYKAMAGVNDALSLRAQLMEQEQQLQQILARAYESERLNEIRYREGATRINYWLNAQEQRRLAQVAVDTNRYEQLWNLAQIYLEFGGDIYPL
jgi:outer membrane protein TolC